MVTAEKLKRESIPSQNEHVALTEQETKAEGTSMLPTAALVQEEQVFVFL